MILIAEGKNYSITSECHEPRIPGGFLDLAFNKIIPEILGKKYFASIAFVREKKMRKINKEYRNKDESTDVLAFNLKEEGEILFSLPNMRKKSREFGMEASEYLSYLLIHAVVHLKGLDHGSKMDRLEKKFCNIFNIRHPHNKIEKDHQNEPKNNSRNRHRNIPSKGSGIVARKSARIS
ncbi:MAG TPA: rRNA maturation RNase YbeY [Candidatus Paceibacterota bacterium]